MSRVRFSGVGFAHPGAPPVFSDLDLDLGPGWTAVAGPNGAGKTTLLRLIAGELAPSRGSIAREPAELRVAFCRQAPDEPTPEVLSFAWSWQGTAPRLRARFGLDPDALDRWATLSPGERQRWQIAAALDLEPDVLLLDEPTNHLDARARDLLASMLGAFSGIGLVVAHDRAFLDALATRTLWIEGGRAASYSGGYSEARRRMDEA
ncbi:MAG TPA: ATP-binding cassette domain-containing protein, partial [Sandaracinaceae bacterium]